MMKKTRYIPCVLVKGKVKRRETCHLFSLKTIHNPQNHIAIYTCDAH